MFVGVSAECQGESRLTARAVVGGSGEIKWSRRGAAAPACRFDGRTGDSLLQCTGMGRLENIIARNQRPNRPRERLVVTLGFGAIVLLILGLMVFTDLGIPPDPHSAGAPAAPDRRGKHVDGVLLRTSGGSTPRSPRELHTPPVAKPAH
jgi:hypothetical protein